jgi:hypothetical protein
MEQGSCHARRDSHRKRRRSGTGTNIAYLNDLRVVQRFAAMSQICRNLQRWMDTGVLRQLDESLEHANEGSIQANRNFAQASRYIEAVQAGREAATRSQSDDVIRAYQALRPQAQIGFRTACVRCEPLLVTCFRRQPGLLHDARASQ